MFVGFLLETLTYVLDTTTSYVRNPLIYPVEFSLLG